VSPQVLRRDSLASLVEHLLREHQVYAPADEQSFVRIQSADELRSVDEHRSSNGVDWLETRPVRSLKELFFPQREVLFTYKLNGDGTVKTPERSADPRVILGARPCDAAAFPILDKLFTWDYLDSFYLEARENTTIVSVACAEPCASCFCTSLGGSPVGVEGADVLLTPLDDVYHVEAITPRGQQLCEQIAPYLEQAQEHHEQARAAFEEDATSKITKEADTARLTEALDFDSPVWETIAQQCIDCGICTFLCPTCHCFDIQDEGNPVEGERVRLWDACTFYNYTKAHAGQPRPTHHSRYRQRIMHKFKYYPENFGRMLCVGCGRCISHCPVNIDLTAVLSAAKESTV
jgi:ferredoxin